MGEPPLRRAQPGTDGGPDGLRAADVLGIGSCAQRLEKICIEAYRNDCARAVAKGLAASLAQLLDRIAGLGFVCPGLDLVIADGLAFDRPRGHQQIVIRKYGQVDTSARAVIPRTRKWGPRRSPRAGPRVLQTAAVRTFEIGHPPR